MTNSDYIRQLRDDQLARAMLGTFTHQYCTSPDPLKCPKSWDEELNCSPCESCVRKWLKEERRDEH